MRVWKCSLSSAENSSGPEDPLSDSSSKKLLSGVASRVPGDAPRPDVDVVVESPDPSLLGRNGCLLKNSVEVGDEHDDAGALPWADCSDDDGELPLW